MPYTSAQGEVLDYLKPHYDTFRQAIAKDPIGSLYWEHLYARQKPSTPQQADEWYSGFKSLLTNTLASMGEDELAEMFRANDVICDALAWKLHTTREGN